MKDCIQPCRELSKLEEKTESQDERLTKVELATRNNENNIKDIAIASGRKEEMIKNLIEKIDNLESRLFSFLSSFADNHSKDSKDWKELIKYVIGITIGALITYIIGKGGI